jgi:hypothetical protein
MEYTDRYGGPGGWPDPGTMCKGQCEGMGWVPVKGGPADPSDDPMRADSALCTEPDLLALWAEAEAEGHAEDGWHFVTCPTCGGTGRCG